MPSIEDSEVPGSVPGRAEALSSRLLIVVLLSMALVGCARPAQRQVVVYTAWDQVYSEPILQRYERQTGVRVLARYDVEAAKTTGLVQALIGQARRPSCDVFWSNEVAQTCRLARRGLLESYASPQAALLPIKDPENRWVGFAARARVILYNKDLVGDKPPASLLELADPRWKGRCGLPSPLFGTSASQAAALFDRLGADRAREFYRQIQANQVRIVDGNARLMAMIAEGKLAWGVVDTDDANLALSRGKPVVQVVPDQDPGGLGLVLLPNTVMLMKGGPHPEEGRLLIDFLLSAEVEESLARSQAVQIPLRPGLPAPPGVLQLERLQVMPVDWDRAAADWDQNMQFMQEVFAR